MSEPTVEDIHMPGKECPHCTAVELWLGTRLIAKPIGTHSLAGGQLKVTARWGGVVTCRACGAGGEVTDVEEGDGKTSFGVRWLNA